MKIILFNLLVLLLTTSPLYANFQLSTQELKLLNNGRYIIKKNYNNDKSWPTYTIIAKINATPLESFAIFSAFNLQTKYVPNLLSAKPKQQKAGVVDVSYVLDLPWPIPNAVYINRHTLLKKNNEYHILWKQVSSSSTDEAIGGARFFTYQNKTLVVYNNFLKPNSVLAVFFKSKMRSDTIRNLKVVIKTITNWSKLKSSNYKKSIKKAKLILSNKIAY